MADEQQRRFIKPGKMESKEPRSGLHIADGPSVFELTEIAASVLTTGFEVPNNDDENNNSNSGPQGHNDNEDPESQNVTDHGPTNIATPVNLAIALWTMSLLTLSMDIATALYKPAIGVVFGRNKEAYYLTLAAIFLSGVAEAFTAYWMSRSRDAHTRRFFLGRLVLCTSIGPFVAILGIGGFAFIQG